MNEKMQSWNKVIIKSNHSTINRMFPTEYMLRALFSNSYFDSSIEVELGMKALDVGCLYANNLIPFSDRGFDLYGVEINEDMIEIAKESSKTWGIVPRILKGNNRILPFENNFFDIVLSINAIHYENNRSSLLEALKEFKRVGKEKSTYLISTVSDEHIFHKTAKRLDENEYKLEVEDFRSGQVMSYFDSIEHFSSTLKEFFNKVEVVEISEKWPKNPLGFWVAKCHKS